MSRLGYEALEHTADAAFRVWGKDLPELFSKAAEAMYSVMVDVASVRPRISRALSLSAPDVDLLLHDWLSELLFLTDVEGLVFSRFEVEVREEDGSLRLEAVCWGEPIDPERHSPETEVKAVTYHDLEVREEGGVWVAKLVLDI